MLEPVQEMVRNVTALILLAAFMELILPSSSMQKYVKVVMGLFLIVCILGPVMSLINRNMTVEVSAWQFPDQSRELNSIMENGRNISLESEKMALEEYGQRLEAQVEALVALNPGVGAVKAKVEVSGKDKLAAGRIERVLLLVEPRQSSGAAGEGESIIPEIEPINVGQGSTPAPDTGAPVAGDSGSEAMIRQVRETVSNFYGIPEEKVQVVVSGNGSILTPTEKNRR